MKRITKTLVAAAAFASLAAGSMAVNTGGALAAAATTGTIAEQCSQYAADLPNIKWGFSWVAEGDRVPTGTTYENWDQAGVSGNVVADVVTSYTQSGTCVAVNPAGIPNLDHSVTGVEITTTSTESDVKVCTQGGTDLAGALCPPDAPH
jgi:hypothetical protein